MSRLICLLRHNSHTVEVIFGVQFHDLMYLQHSVATPTTRFLNISLQPCRAPVLLPGPNPLPLIFLCSVCSKSALQMRSDLTITSALYTAFFFLHCDFFFLPDLGILTLSRSGFSRVQNTVLSCSIPASIAYLLLGWLE